jgi:hypothetical protein
VFRVQVAARLPGYTLLVPPDAAGESCVLQRPGGRLALRLLVALLLGGAGGRWAPAGLLLLAGWRLLLLFHSHSQTQKQRLLAGCALRLACSLLAWLLARASCMAHGGACMGGVGRLRCCFMRKKYT